MLERARLARDSGQVVSPAGDNAVELFAAAVAIDPTDSLVAAELDAAIGEAFRLTETAILDSRPEDAETALLRIQSVDPENPRLTFLTAQVSLMLNRPLGELVETVAAENPVASDGNAATDPASSAVRNPATGTANPTESLEIARQQAGSNPGQIASIQQSLIEHPELQSIDDILDRAEQKLQVGDLLSPVNDNARYYYQLALSWDPESSAAQQGISAIASTLVFQARNEMSNGDISGAEDILAHAMVVDPNNSDVSEAIAELDNQKASAARNPAAASAPSQTQLDAERRNAAERQAELDRQAAADR